MKQFAEGLEREPTASSISTLGECIRQLVAALIKRAEERTTTTAAAAAAAATEKAEERKLGPPTRFRQYRY